VTGIDDVPEGEYAPFSFTVRLRDATFDRPGLLSMYERTERGVTEAHELTHYIQETATVVRSLGLAGLPCCLLRRSSTTHRPARHLAAVGPREVFRRALVPVVPSDTRRCS